MNKPKGTILDYYAISACDEHCNMFHDAFADMKNIVWGQKGMC